MREPMSDHLMRLYKLRFLFAGILIVVSLFLVSLLVVSLEPPRVQAQDTTPSSGAVMAEAYGDPNAVSSGMATALDGAKRSVNATAYTLAVGTRSAAEGVVGGGRLVAHGAQVGTVATARVVGKGLLLTARGIGRGVAATGRVVGGGVLFVVRIPGKIVGAVSNTSAVRAVIRPSDHVDVPVIDPNSPELAAALTALPPTPQKAQPKTPTSGHEAGPKWPIHGQITTEFGVEHWPYQKTHTGLDISDGKWPGVTPIKPFRPGRVIHVTHSAYGLGNHVIVDHGSGVTSVYAHLYSIAVKVGQEVDQKTTLGLEGSTGASTGTHLHFEVRVNGKAADPRRFISGHP
jgi:murein DD-endopeptidase MepM/ murein hydrolase activator NlpD